MEMNDIKFTNLKKPVFGNSKVNEEHISQQTKVTYISKPDEFVKEESMSTTTKIAIGLGSMGVIALGVWGFIRGKGARGLKNAQKAVTKTAQDIAENVEKPGQNTVKKTVQSLSEEIEPAVNKAAQKINTETEGVISRAQQIGEDISVNTSSVKPKVVEKAGESSVEHITATTQKITKKSAEEIKSVISSKADFWKVSPEAIDEKTAEILSKHLPEDIRFVNADIFARSLIKESAEVTGIKEKTALLEKAVELLPKGSWNGERYSDALRKEILENILQITKDPKSAEAQKVIKALGESIKKEDYLFEKILKEAPEEFDFFSYSRIKRVATKEELSDIERFDKGAILPFLHEKLLACGSSPKEKLYFTEKALNIFERNPHATGCQFNWMRTYTTAANIPELRPRVEKAISNHLNNLFPELETSKLSFDAKKNVLRQIWEFKQGSGSIIKASEYTPYDKINDILTILFNSEKKRIKQLSTEETAILKETASKIAKKSGKAYENTLANYYETGIFNIFEKKGDKWLDLSELRGTRYFTQEEEKIAYEYIECGDTTTGGAFSINNLLRTSSKKELQKRLASDRYMKKTIEGLDKLTTDAEHAVPYDCVVLRAMGNGEHIDAFRKVGNIVTDKGFVSTTPSMGTYTNMFGGRPGESYIMRIKLPKGTTGCNMKRCKGLYWGGNEELLLPRNSQFKVLEVDDNAKIIEVEYLLPKK